MRTFVAVMVIVGFFGTAIGTSAQMDSASYQIRWDTVGNGGDDTSSSSSYILRDTTGGTGIGDSSSASYDLGAGYRAGVSGQVLDFSFFAQDSGVSAEATGLAGLTIDCDPTDFSIGDMVALLQDKGEGQVTAIGRIVSTGIDSITLDALKDGGVAPVIDGTNDYVALLDGDLSALGTLSASVVRTSVIGLVVSTSAPDGYAVQIVADGDFRDGAETVDPIADGLVSIGSEEYGARSSDSDIDSSTFDSEDSALSMSFQPIADNDAAVTSDRNFLVTKAAISSTTVAGSYAQTLTLIVSGHY